ncbi:MAG: TIGR00266 family protein [Akkermansiaceae bacterium]|nr:TIGR00266 family protein [Verrucomicrobiales bacterium]
MKTEILHAPGNAAARITLEPNETITTEGGAMIAMSADLGIQTTTQQRSGGGLLKAAKRMLSGESFFLNHYTAGASGGEVWLAATLPGDMMKLALAGETIIVQAGSYVACSEGISMDMSWQGFKSFLSGESAFWIRISGNGRVVLSSYGAIYPVEVDGEHIIDTGHIVAFDETLKFTLTKAGKSWIGSMLGGEGIVCKFHGKGVVWCQSHNARSFGGAIGPLLKPR